MDPFQSENEHPFRRSPIAADRLPGERAPMKATWVPIQAPVGPWHSPQEIRAWIRGLEARRATAEEEQAPTDAVDAALEQARGWLSYAEKRWAIGRKPRT
jgi:hypothetical protein